LVTTYVFIGGTVWLNIDTAHGVADAVAHALSPLAYAVLVEMLAHLLRLHMKLAQPAKPRLSALTWLTSPVITTRVWLHLSRTGGEDPAAARALVQQVVRMASRLATLCPSRKLWPLDAARAARTAALQTIRDGLLSAGGLAALLPAGGRLTPGELLAVVDTAALGLTAPGEAVEAVTSGSSRAATEHDGAPLWLVAYLLGALRTESASAPVHPATRTAPPAPVHKNTHSSAPAPVHPANRTAVHADPVAAPASDDRTDDELLALVRQHAATEHNGAPMSQRAIRRITGVGTPRAKRLAELAGWTEPADGTATPEPQVRGQLQLVAEPGENPTGHDADTDTETPSTPRTRNEHQPMNSPHNMRSAASHQDSNAPETTTTEPTIQQPPAGSSRTQELRSHQCITIKWSLDSDSRRRIGWRCPNVACRNQIVEPGWLPAAVAIDWSLTGERIGDRVRPLADKTMQRIRAGLARYVKPELLVPVEGRDGKTAAPLSEAMRTMTTRNETGLLVPAGGTWNETATRLAEVMRTRTTRESEALVVPLRNNNTTKKPTDPFDTFAAAGNHHGLLMPYYGNATSRQTSEPHGTFTTRDRYALVMRNNGSRSDGAEMCTPVVERCGPSPPRATSHC
jgi:hypothetical protein